MIEKWLKLLAGFIVEAFCEKLGITNIDDLISKGATAFKQEITEDLDKLDDIPGKVITGVVPQLMAPVQQMVGQVQQIVQTVGNIPGQIMGSIQNLLNPFK